MKPLLPVASLVVAFLGLLSGTLNVLLAALRLSPPPDRPGAIALAVLQAAVGAAQVIPGLGVYFALHRDRPWPSPKKALWVAWAMAAVPLLAASLLSLVLWLLGRI